MYSCAFKPSRATVRTIPQMPALYPQVSCVVEGRNVQSLQNSKTQATGHRNLLLTLHVEIPDDEPGQNGEAKVGDNEPS